MWRKQRGPNRMAPHLIVMAEKIRPIEQMLELSEE